MEIWKSTMLLAGLALAGLIPNASNAQQADNNYGLNFKGSLGENGFTHYVPPLTNPVFNETPYITTELRPIYFYDELPDDFVTGGGHINLVAAQFRIALTDRLGFIATKDGYADAHFKHVLDDETGFANIAFGMKYALLSDPQSNTIITGGLRYEIPLNDLQTGGIELEGDGDGFLNPFVTGATTIGDLGLQASLGGNFALDTDKDTSIMHYSLHADYEVLPGLFPLIELNGFTAIDNADRTAGALSQLDGVDVLNFGSKDRDTTITIGGGARYALLDNLMLGVGGETPITGKNNTIMDYRLYADLVWTY
ncbi:MAG: transporter [Geminicoccaceae bacterium]|nr:transporter [Geminicoccaceae bacterium]MCB9944820.1 transporter [Geminicoccaceae bacterium]